MIWQIAKDLPKFSCPKFSLIHCKIHRNCGWHVITVEAITLPWADQRNLQGVCNGCNMAMRDLPDMYAQSLRAYISGKSLMPMLQLLCITLFP